MAGSQETERETLLAALSEVGTRRRAARSASDAIDVELRALVLKAVRAGVSYRHITARTDVAATTIVKWVKSVEE